MALDSAAGIERALHEALASCETNKTPPGLARAMRHAVFPAGGRIRPTLCLGVAQACSGAATPVTMAAAVSTELVHCASLVHDDLPCFDDAPLRRGRPAVHVAFGEPLAVLAGDALIVLAFATLARGAVACPHQLPALIEALSDAAGTPHGLMAGQAWECEPGVDLQTYHRAKTGSMFIAACAAGAISVDDDPEPWRHFGSRVGEAYQIIDDVLDVTGSAEALGKPVAQDSRNGRPNILALHSVGDTQAKIASLMEEAGAAIPRRPEAAMLRGVLAVLSQRFGRALDEAKQAAR